MTISAVTLAELSAGPHQVRPDAERNVYFKPAERPRRLDELLAGGDECRIRGGREHELSALLGALGGDARLVLVVGDAGVGKTQFVAEAMDRAAAAGMVMLRGECLPLAGTLPLLPVASALGELAGLEDGQVLAAALEAAPGYVRAEVARLLPGLGGGDGTGPEGRDGELSQGRLFTAVAELLAASTQRSSSRVGLVVEDVHWADSATLDFLTFLAWAGRGGTVTVVVTCRGDEAPLAAHVVGWLAQVQLPTSSTQPARS